MIALQLLASEFVITITNASVWLSIGLALLTGAGCWAFGTWFARTVGLLKSQAPAGETLGVGLATGLMVSAAWWAAVWSGGRSSFTPVAVGFAVALGMSLVQRARRPVGVSAAADDQVDRIPPRPSHRRSLILTAVAAGVFIVAVALLYGSTMVPSPRDGVQPVEFVDEAYYAVLGRDLATTGIETVYSASGFSDLPGLPTQTWYHWGEMWLAAAIITILGTEPLAARYFVVLPLVLLAGAALTGTLVRRITGTKSRRAYLLGFLTFLFLAPLPSIPGPFFSNWAVGMIFGITSYGLGAVALTFALYCLVVAGHRVTTWALAVFVGAAVAFILPAHIAVAVLALIGVVSASAIRIGQSVWATHRVPNVPLFWRRALVAAGCLLVSTVVWGLLTGHGLGRSAPPIVPPFNPTWAASVAITLLGAGALIAIPFAWFIVRKSDPAQAALYAGALAVLAAGAIGWGLRVGDFTTFYLFYGAIAVIVTPLGASAIWTAWQRLRATHHLRLATGLLALCVIQLDYGALLGIQRLQVFGPHEYEPIPSDILDEIKQLPAGSKLAYGCLPLEEIGFGTPQLLSIDAHTGRRIVPMCFEAEVLSTLIGAPRSEQVESLFFREAPQRGLYPNAEARPSSSEVATFLKRHGIAFIYADAVHPNSLVIDAMPIVSVSDSQILRIP